MEVPKILAYVEYVAFGIAAVCLFFVLFLIGDTDALSEPPTWVTITLMVGGSLCATVGAGLHWVGKPVDSETKGKKKKGR